VGHGGAWQGKARAGNSVQRLLRGFCAMFGRVCSGRVWSGMAGSGAALAAYSGFNESAMRCVSIMGSARSGMLWRCRDWYGKVI
jgi:hypothetical protein